GVRPLRQLHSFPTRRSSDLIPKDEDAMYLWRIKSQGNVEARQQFLDGYVPQIWELGLTVPDPKLRKKDDGVWEFSEPDWDELKRSEEHTSELQSRGHLVCRL